MSWEFVAGLEIHAQLMTETKAFCRCPNRYGAPPNTLVCPTCLGMPGALPVLNAEVVRQAAKLAIALGAKVHPYSKFDRKNYFYPDLPKGYQISQFDQPFSTGGSFEIDTKSGVSRIRITRAHIEEDAGKSMHTADGSTVVDMNRCGVPLVEIVTEPDFTDASDAAAFVSQIRELLRFIDVCDGNMEEASLRCDANVSVRKTGETELRERCEMKNLNSTRNVERAILAEVQRQIAIYESGGTVRRQTLLWDEAKEELRPMRAKEGSEDYRYFPEPDLVGLEMQSSDVDEIRKSLPELPASRRRRYRDEYMLHPEAIFLLATHREFSDYFENLVRNGSNPQSASGWITGDVQRVLKENNWSVEQFTISAERLSALITIVDSGKLSRSKAKDVFRTMLSDLRSAEEIIKSEGLSQIRDEGALRGIAIKLAQDNADVVAKYRSGKKNLLGFFVGEMMKSTGGQAEPQLVKKIVEEILESNAV